MYPSCAELMLEKLFTPNKEQKEKVHCIKVCVSVDEASYYYLTQSSLAQRRTQCRYGLKRFFFLIY